LFPYSDLVTSFLFTMKKAMEATDIETTEQENKPKEENFDELVKQVESEFTSAINYIRPKWNKWVTRLKLYNNQKRDDSAVGSPLLFTTFQTVFASLYDDELTVEFEGKEAGDEEVAENLNNLSTSDAPVMEMDIFTHDFQWDAAFFGRSIADLSEFSREKEEETTIPYVIDPLTFLRDPNAISVRGNHGRGKLRFCGYEVLMTMSEIEQIQDFMHIDKVRPSVESTEIQKNHMLRQAAQGYDQKPNTQSTLVGENKEYVFYVWYTYHKGRMVRLLMSADKATVHRYYVLPYQRYFPLVDCPIYPIPNDWDGVSIPDLTEDKQRHSAAVINASLRSVKFSQNPGYLFNQNKMNKNEIAKTEFGNMIPVDGSPTGEVQLLPRETIKSDAQWILDVLDGSAQRATATPEIQQGVTARTKRTLGELNLVSSKVDTRYSLTAKLFGNAYKRFWYLWYFNYKTYFGELIDEKMIRINGANGAKWRVLTKENIVSEYDPDIIVDSREIVESKRFNKLNLFSAFHSKAVMDPGYNIRGGLKQIAKLSGIKTDEVNILFRKSADEVEAEEENEILGEDKLY